MIDLNLPVGRLVAERPERSRVFEEFDIDFCCGGKQSLWDACRNRKLDPDLVRRRLEESDAGPSEPGQDWEAAPLSDLCNHIVETHHAFLKAELPRVGRLLTKVAHVHGDRHPEMVHVLEVFESFARDLFDHMAKEERVLFPMIKRLASGELAPNPSLLAPFQVMEAEHDDAGRAMAEMREQTAGYQPPSDGCNTFRAALDGLRGVERDMHRHVHLENNVLFPQAEKLIPAPAVPA